MDIQTSFVNRGRPAAEKTEKDYVRQELARVRATAMEGSFGTQKEHYAMRRIKARKKRTEILYIFFGIHTANVVHLAERLDEQEQAKAAYKKQSGNQENGVLRRELHVNSRLMSQKQAQNTGNPSENAITARPIPELVKNNTSC